MSTPVQQIQRELERRRSENQDTTESPVTNIATDSGPSINASDVRIPDVSQENLSQMQQRGGFNPLENPVSSFDDQIAEQIAQEEERRRREAEERRIGEISPQTRYQRDNLYGERPEEPGFLTRASAVAGSIIDALRPGQQEPSEAQTEVREYLEQDQEWLRQATETYETLGKDQGVLGGRTALIAVPDAESEAGSRVVEVRLPNPYIGSFEDIIFQTANTVLQQSGDLVLEGKLTDTGEFSRETPDLQLSNGEQLTSDILSFFAPGLGAAKGVKAVGRGYNTVENVVRRRRGQQPVQGSTRAGTAAATAGNIAAQSGVAATIATEEDTPLIASSGMFEDVFKMSPERAQDAAIIADNLIVDGAFSALSRPGRAIGNWFKNKAAGVTSLINPRYLENATQRQTVMNTVKFLDPEIDADGNTQTLRNLQTFADTLGSNANLEAVLGNQSRDIPVPTINALMQGAENYIRVTRQRLRNEMSSAEFDEFVNEEATKLVNRAVGLNQQIYQQGEDVAMRTAQTTEAIRGLVDDAVESQAPVRPSGEAVPPNQAMDETTEMLANQRRQDLASAQTNVEAAQDQVAAAEDAVGRVVSDNEIVQNLLQDAPSPGSFLRLQPYNDRLRSLVGEDLYNEYVRTFDEVDAAYKAIPNDPLPEENILEFGEQLRSVVRAANEMDSSGSQAKGVLGRIYDAFQPQPLRDSSGNLVRDEADNLVLETPEDLLDRLGEIGFQDMYEVKRQLSRTIDDLPDGPVKNRVIDLRNHITDAESGQIALLRDNGAEEVAEAAQEADSTFKTAMSRFQNSEALRQYSDRAGTVRAVGDTFRDIEGSARRGEPDMIDTAVNQVLPRVMDDPSGVNFEQFTRAFGDVMSDRSLSDALGERTTAEAMYSLSRALERGDRQSAQTIIDAITPYRDRIERFNPELLDRLSEASTQVSREQATREQLLEQSRIVLSEAQEAQTRAQNNILSRLMSPNSDDVEAISNPMAKIREFMNNPDSANIFRRLNEEIARLPNAQERAFAQRSLKSATLKNATDLLFTKSDDAAISPTQAGRRPSRAKIRAITEDEANNVMRTIDAVFADDEIMRQSYRTLLVSLLDTTTPGAISFARGQSPTASNLSIRDAVSTSILLTAGYMNPTAAAARRLSAETVAASEQQVRRVEKRTLERILANPEMFANMVNEVREAQQRGAGSDVMRQLARAAQTQFRLNAGESVQTAVESAESAVDREDETEQMLRENEVQE